jgi:hypothetical protein
LEGNRFESEPVCERHPCRGRSIHRNRIARQDPGASSRASPGGRQHAPRIAGRFKGDVQVDGNFRIDPGARLEGQVRAGVVVVGGELQGNIDAAKQLDVLSTGVIVGDVKAASITVAAGSRMRGHVEFGWDDKHAAVELKGTSRSV